MANPISAIEGAVGKVLRDFKYELIVAFAGAEVENIVHEYLTNHRLTIDPIPEGLANLIAGPVGEAERVIGSPLFELLINAPSGAGLSREPGAQERNAVEMIERMLGFAIALPYGLSKLKMLLEATMGENAAKGLVEAIEKIPEEIGINWALGTTLANIMEVAAGRPIEEAIAFQSRPLRMEWQQVRALSRLHVLPDDVMRERLARMGWRDEDIPLLSELDRQRLTVGDLQQVYLAGLRDEAWVRRYLNDLGLQGEDEDAVVDLYLKRAETAGGDQLRAVAQRGYLDSHLTKQQYVELLRAAFVPERSIVLEVEAADMVKLWGQKQLSIAEIKKLHSDGIIDDGQAVARLRNEGYTDNDATALVGDWKIEKRVAHSGFNENRILAYLASGILDKKTAYDKLLEAQVRPEDAAFLVEHPEAGQVTKSHGSDAATIIGAFTDEILTRQQAIAQLELSGFDPDAAELRVQVAEVRFNRGKKPKQPHRTLSEAHIVTAFELGLATSAWATRELVVSGLSETDALLVVAEVETKKNKGKIPDGWATLE